MYLVQAGQPINAEDVNQVARVLQRQSGQQETGHYFAATGSYATNCVISTWISSLSRGTTPVSVSFNTSFDLLRVTNVQTGHLGADGFQIFGYSTQATTNAGFGGAWTISY